VTHLTLGQNPSGNWGSQVASQDKSGHKWRLVSFLCRWPFCTDFVGGRKSGGEDDCPTQISWKAHVCLCSSIIVIGTTFYFPNCLGRGDKLCLHQQFIRISYHQEWKLGAQTPELLSASLRGWLVALSENLWICLQGQPGEG
jgi:hypothetical protein